MRLRNSAKAVVVRDGRVLLTRCVDHRGEWYCFPGGGQEPGETLAEAAQRECLEETGAEVSVGKMLTVLEWHDNRNATHAIEFYFLCTLNADSDATVGAAPDTMQVGVEWIELQRLSDIILRPPSLKPVLVSLTEFQYLGLVEGIK